MAFCINKTSNKQKQTNNHCLKPKSNICVQIVLEYVDTDKENAYTKTEWANLKFITISAKY